ncbi:hypothetical protein HID58_025503 [Brassica napus]|uniref:Uncharacterized protein n=1 Tax=Brassica napus TaxID=3708 RepID=A0ABQ7ZIA2_BRANA|nr:hypothetical protein HID58_067356 [Brassica napus]KAH0917843.1 hypothetical protein HID58_025503 [Brassica napus]
MNSFHLAYNSSDSLRFSIYNFLSDSLITYSTHIQTNLSASMASKILNDGAVSQLIFALKPLSSDLSLIFYLLSGDFHTPSNLGEVNSVTHMFRLSPRLSSMLLYAGKDCTSVTNMSISGHTIVALLTLKALF